MFTVADLVSLNEPWCKKICSTQMEKNNAHFIVCIYIDQSAPLLSTVIIIYRMRSFVKIKPSWNSKITLSIADVGESCTYIVSRVFQRGQIEYVF